MFVDPVTMVLVPGVLGGLILAWVIFWRQSRSSTPVSPDVFTRNGRSSDVINMAHIRVAGIGGLGLVAMAATVALNVPRIGQALAIAAVAGAVFAAVLIAWRRKAGALPSSGARPGANTVLAIDAPHTTDERHPAADRSRELKLLMCDDIGATIAELKAKGIHVEGEPEDRRVGITVMLKLPGGVEVMLYEPRHAMAI